MFSPDVVVQSQRRMSECESRGDIQRFGARQDLIANPRIQELRCHHVHAPALQESGDLALDGDEVQAGNVTRLEFDQYVDVAIWSKIVAKYRAEQG
jgi:hypothetical protein